MNQNKPQIEWEIALNEEFRIAIGPHGKESSYDCEGGYCQLNIEKLKDFIRSQRESEYQRGKREAEQEFEKLIKFMVKVTPNQ